MTDDSGIEVRDEPAKHRFEILVDGEVAGWTAYRFQGEAYAFTHTQVHETFEGQGLASRLVGTALGELRDRGASALPYCPFVRAYLVKHADLRSVVPESDRARFDLA